jgi:hypothetical protein
MRKIKNLLLAAAVLVAGFVATVQAAEPPFRRHTVHQLTVRPGTNGSRTIGTNVAEFASPTGTNAIVVTTNQAAGVGPRLAVRLGTNLYFAVTNRSIIVTNSGTVTTNVFRNGLLVEQ